ncbi:hypothetical protein RHGRI_031059 [Rhododendron griersonianum]|uniref:J domain-containing protein n=1 Tax=Rhododendron griersonianum TaxID=479676 RepID=A0AAV6IC54_9ERIC|nr:hypothetical protein RHGRI_031059 [Rhododendron griersonianum]
MLSSSFSGSTTTATGYAVLQLDRRSDDTDLIKKQYRRLALLLHPDKNKCPFADAAICLVKQYRRLALLLHPDKNKCPFADAAIYLVADSWAVLSDLQRKSLYDNKLSMCGMFNLVVSRSDGDRGQKS